MRPYTTVIASYVITHRKLCFNRRRVTYQRHLLSFEVPEKLFYWRIDVPMSNILVLMATTLLVALLIRRCLAYWFHVGFTIFTMYILVLAGSWRLHLIRFRVWYAVNSAFSAILFRSKVA